MAASGGTKSCLISGPTSRVSARATTTLILQGCAVHVLQTLVLSPCIPLPEPAILRGLMSARVVYFQFNTSSL